MAHQHAHSHLVRRQRDEEDDDSDRRRPGVATVISVKIVTAENTNTGRVVWITQEAPKTLVAPAIRSHTSTVDEDEPEETATPSSRKPSSSDESDAEVTTKATFKQPSTLMVATKSPTPSAGSAAAGIASATAAVSAAASSDASEGGMTGGAKAGLALGILALVGALLVGILVIYRRKKNKMAGKNENEKINMYDAPPPPPPQVQAAPPAPSIRTQRTMSTAPRLSLRPVTQFDPTFNEQRKSGGNLLNVAAAGGAAYHSRDRDLPERPTSAWERPGATNAPATNPFNDPENHSGPPSANPFGNSAALDAHQANIPDSPPNASPFHSTQPSTDFANPAVAIAAAEMDPVAAAGAMSSIPSPENDLPLPPSINGSIDGVPPSPAWTDDLPASPGPAPTGPPPVAGAMAGNRSNSPAPGPNNVHRIQLDFKASMQDELNLQAGQLVRMLHEYDDGWVSSHTRISFPDYSHDTGALHPYGPLATRCCPQNLSLQASRQASYRSASSRPATPRHARPSHPLTYGTRRCSSTSPIVTC